MKHIDFFGAQWFDVTFYCAKIMSYDFNISDRQNMLVYIYLCIVRRHLWLSPQIITCKTNKEQNRKELEFKYNSRYWQERASARLYNTAE